MGLRRNRIQINGIVQGVGFRPFVYRLAQEYKLGGFVNNSSDGVLIEVEGTPDSLKAFRKRLQTEAPPLARIVDWHLEEINPIGEADFSIKASQHEAPPITLISPDISICEDCLGELFDPTDRRFRYPFINCTNCGPRYTIVHSIPYDRPYTSMHVFNMCGPCSREYHDPANRRFHAQPNACPVCGPKISLHDSTGKKINTYDPILNVVQLLRSGKIIAIRGIGGFHLAVDAHNDTAVQELRRRKGRAEKPFAMMAPDLESIKKFCFVSSKEEEVLIQQTRPIVLLRARPNHPLAASIAPGNRYLGFMLPYTPLHYLILQGNFDALVMTSGNYSEEPIAIGNDEALERLSCLADYFLLHDREILQRSDDSIVRLAVDEIRLIRRSRGYVPMPLFLSSPTRKRILACGGELKNTIALSRDNTVFLSQHIGDLDNPSAFAFFENSIAHLQKILEITPEIIA
ncbi:MAG: carbamoyltransferase HypF, partial [bacterium]